MTQIEKATLASDIGSLRHWLNKIDEASVIDSRDLQRIRAAIHEARNEIAYLLTREVA